VPGSWDGEELHGGCFPFLPQKIAFSIFGVLKLGFFMRQLSKRQIVSCTKYIIGILDRLRYIYELSYRRVNLCRYLLNFAQAPPNFAKNGVALHFSANKTSSWFFAKNIFRYVTCDFFTKLWPLKRDSTSSGGEREFSCVVNSCGSQIGRN
jgi:hypothetical protein